MLKLYSRANFDSTTTGFYVFDEIDDLIKYLEEFLVTSIDNKYYWVDDLHVIIPKLSQNLNTLTYLIDVEQFETRCYFVKHAYRDNSGIHLILELDKWATGLAKATISNLLVQRTNRDIQGVGILDDIRLTEEAIYKNYQFNDSESRSEIPMKELCMVCLINYNFTESIFSGSATSKTELFFFNVGELKESYIKSNSSGIEAGIEEFKTFSAIDIAVAVVGGINSIEINGQSNKCQVLNCWFIEESLFYTFAKEEILFKSTNSIPRSTGVKMKRVIAGVTRYYNFEITNKEYDFINNNLRLGTKFNSLKLNRYHLNKLTPRVRVLTTNDAIQVVVEDGESMLDITDAFRVDLTFNEGNVTALKGVSNTLKTINNLFSSGANLVGNIADKNVSKSVSSGLGLATNVIDRWDASPYGRYINSGDGITTFRNTVTADKIVDGKLVLAGALNPWYVITNKSRRNEVANIFFNGINFNEPCHFEDVFLAPLIVETTEVNAINDFETYLQGDCIVGGCCSEFADYIAAMIRSGIRLHKI